MSLSSSCAGAGRRPFAVLTPTGGIRGVATSPSRRCNPPSRRPGQAEVQGFHLLFLLDPCSGFRCKRRVLLVPVSRCRCSGVTTGRSRMCCKTFQRWGNSASTELVKSRCNSCVPAHECNIPTPIATTFPASFCGSGIRYRRTSAAVAKRCQIQPLRVSSLPARSRRLLPGTLRGRARGRCFGEGCNARRPDPFDLGHKESTRGELSEPRYPSTPLN